MKKSTLLIMAMLLAVFLASMLFLRSYKLYIVQTVVVDAVIQRAPEDYPRHRIEETFQNARLQAGLEKREQAYLERLLRLSQRLEKVQHIREQDLNDLLESMSRPPRSPTEPLQ